MNRRTTVVAALGVAVAGALFVSYGCDRTSKQAGPLRPEIDSDILSGGSNNLVTLLPAFDTFFERKLDEDCYTGTCDLSAYNTPSQCGLLRLQQWDDSECIRTHIALDFRTDLIHQELPANAQVSGVDQAALAMYLTTAYQQVVEEQPTANGCGPLPFNTSNPVLHFGHLNWYRITPDTVGVFTHAPILEIGCRVNGVSLGNLTPYSIPSSVGNWANQNVTSAFTYQHPTRYIFDYDSGVFQTFRGLEFISSDHSSGATLGPRLNLDVDYSVPYAPCLDGQVEHTAATPCESCESSLFNINSTNGIATVKHSETADYFCNESHVVLMFDTSSLKDEHTPASAELRFNVQYELTWGVSQSAVRVYAAQQSGTCPSALVTGDFAYCGSYIDLGTIAIAPGANTFTIPNATSVLNETGITKFVLVDASSYSEPDGSAQFLIHTAETSGTSKDPRLKVNYD